MEMVIDEVESALKLLHMNLDEQTMTKTKSFIENHSKELNNLNQIWAVVAVIAETQQLQCVGGNARSRSGVSIESVMRHLPEGAKKDDFLIALSQLLMKCPELPNWLRLKAKAVQLRFRIYNKFRVTFSALGGGLNRQLQPLLAATAWILYLFTKSSTEEQDSLQSTAVLPTLFKIIFFQLEPTLIEEEFARAFSSSPQPDMKKEEEFGNKIRSKLMEIHCLRHGYKGKKQQRNNLQCSSIIPSFIEKEEDLLSLLKSDEHYTIRFLDDLSNCFEGFKVTLPEQRVDEISFLELIKNLTPLPLKRFEEEVTECACDLNLLSDQEEMEEENKEESFQEEIVPKTPPKPTEDQFQMSSFNRASISSSVLKGVDQIKEQMKSCFTETPLSMMQQAQRWILKHSDPSNDQVCEFQKWAKLRIQQTVSAYKPCSNKRVDEIYSFYKGLSPVRLNQKPQLAIATTLYANAFECGQLGLLKCSQYFEVSVVDMVAAGGWLLQEGNLPAHLTDHLYAIEEQLMLREGWMCIQGGKSPITHILEEHSGKWNAVSSPAVDRKGFFLQRLLSVVKKHFSQLCADSKLFKVQASVVQLITEILRNRSHLTRHLNLNQLIACSLAAVLQRSSLIGLNLSRSCNLAEIQDFFKGAFLPSVEDLLQSQLSSDQKKKRSFHNKLHSM